MLDNILLRKQSWTNINQNLISISYHLTNSSDSYDPDQGGESTVILFIFSKGGCTIYHTGYRLHMNSLQRDCGWQRNSTTHADLTLAYIWHVFHFGHTAPWPVKSFPLVIWWVSSHFTLFLRFSQQPKVVCQKKKVKFKGELWRTTDAMEMVIKKQKQKLIKYFTN